MSEDRRVARSRRAWRWGWLVLATLAVACRPNHESASQWRASEPEVRPAREAREDRGATSWSRQIDEVRVGLRNEIRVATQHIGNDEFALLAGVNGLARLEIDHGLIDDQGLVKLAPQDTLEWLVVRHAPIGDDGCRHLARFANLRILNLPHAKFSDEGLAALADLGHLELLRFGSPNVTDTGLGALRKTVTLKYLHVIDVPLTDAAIDHVSAMALDSFYLDGSQVSDDRLLALIELRPELHVHRDQRHHDRDPRRGHDGGHQ